MYLYCTIIPRSRMRTLYAKTPAARTSDKPDITVVALTCIDCIFHHSVFCTWLFVNGFQLTSNPNLIEKVQILPHASLITTTNALKSQHNEIRRQRLHQNSYTGGLEHEKKSCMLAQTLLCYSLFFCIINDGHIRQIVKSSSM